MKKGKSYEPRLNVKLALLITRKLVGREAG